MKHLAQTLLAIPILASALEPKPLTDEILSALADCGIGDIPTEKSVSFQKALLNALQDGGEPIVGLEITSASQKDGEEDTAAFIVHQSFQKDNSTAVFSIDKFNGNLKNALEDLEGFLAENKAKVLLIDLRESGGDDENAATQFIDFCKGCKVPICVLIDGETHAVAESVLPELKADGATLFGSPTAGRPGKRKSVTLSNGATLHIPQKKSEPISPDVTITHYEAWLQVASDYMIAKGIIMSEQEKKQ
ncbi:MAG: hypothetical protein IJS15_04515 [Victivallales bacterium]|nr:hypothetical protein [Victivallales bacterium]